MLGIVFLIICFTSVSYLALKNKKNVIYFMATKFLNGSNQK